MTSPRLLPEATRLVHASALLRGAIAAMVVLAVREGLPPAAAAHLVLPWSSCFSAHRRVCVPERRPRLARVHGRAWRRSSCSRTTHSLRGLHARRHAELALPPELHPQRRGAGCRSTPGSSALAMLAGGARRTRSCRCGRARSCRLALVGVHPGRDRVRRGVAARCSCCRTSSRTGRVDARGARRHPLVVRPGRSVRAARVPARPALPLARPGGDAADHRADPHRPRDVRLVHAGEGIARRDRRDADPRARGEGPLHVGSLRAGRRLRRATSARSSTSCPPGSSGCGSRR